MPIQVLVSKGMVDKLIGNQEGPFYCKINVGQVGSMRVEDLALLKPLSILAGLGHKVCVVIDPSMLVVMGMDHFAAMQRASEVSEQAKTILAKANADSKFAVVTRDMWKAGLLDFALSYGKIPWSSLKSKVETTYDVFGLLLDVDNRSWMHDFMHFRTEVCMPDEFPIDMEKIGIKDHGFAIMKPLVGPVGQKQVFLSSSLTPVLDFYQYWMNLDDADACRMLPWLTDLPPDELREIELAHAKNPQKRYPQRILSSNMTRFVHGDEMAQRAIAYSNLLFGGSGIKAMDEPTLSWIAKLLPHENLASSLPMPLSKLLCKIGFCHSSAEAKRIISQGGISVNGKLFEEDSPVDKGSLAFGRYAFVLRGKKTYRVAIFEGA